MDRGFFAFRWVKKKFGYDFLAIFPPTLKKILYYMIRKSYVAKFFSIFLPRAFLARVCVFEQNCIYRPSDMLLMPKFIKKFLARTPRAHVYKPMKLGNIFEKISKFREKCEKCMKIFLKFSKMFFNHKMIILYHISHIHYT